MNNKIHTIVHNRACPDSECFDSNGDEIVCAFSSKDEAKRAFRSYLEYTLDEDDFNDLRETSERFAGKTDEEIVEVCLEDERVEFDTWSVRMDSLTVYDKLEEFKTDHPYSW